MLHDGACLRFVRKKKKELHGGTCRRFDGEDEEEEDTVCLSIRMIKGVGELMEVCINFFQTPMRTERDRLCC